MTDHRNILSNIERYVELTEADRNQFSAIVSTQRIKKRQFIVQPGFVCSHQTYVEQGSIRSYYIDPNGNEHTIQFAIEDWFISDFNSYIHQTPATLFLEALEDSTVHQIAFDDVERLCSENPKFERFFRLVAQKAFAYSQRRVLSNIGLSAKERFIEFHGLYPAIVQRVPQYALASYLGMSAEFLSKIRKEILK